MDGLPQSRATQQVHDGNAHFEMPQGILPFVPSNLLRGPAHPQTWTECLLVTMHFEPHDFFNLYSNLNEEDTTYSCLPKRTLVLKRGEMNANNHTAYNQKSQIQMKIESPKVLEMCLYTP